MNRIPINTSFTSHKKCFICRRKKISLKEVSKLSIATSFIEHNIYIPEGTRSCYRHMTKGHIKDDEYVKIPVHVELLDRKIIKSLKSSFKKILECFRDKEISQTYAQPILPLENFRNILTLSEEFCEKFINCSKEAFIRLSSLLSKKIRNTQNRSKSMLIALYLYWLKSGMTQKSLAFYKVDSSQQEISNELKQIRVFINQDITPRYLGFNSVTREFLLSHLTPTVKELYGIKGEQLVFILDGGYERHEKSFNNEFQAATFSGQKKQNLLKSFLVTTCTGYIIECYVDMDARWNDDRILREILATDRHFRNIIRPNDYFFVDR